MTDNVNHPAHYESQRIVLEPIDLCECYDFCLGNAIKYILRAGHKEGNSLEQDLAKARWYLKRTLARPGVAGWVRAPESERVKIVFAVRTYMARNKYFYAMFSGGGKFGILNRNSLTQCIELINETIGEKE